MCPPKISTMNIGIFTDCYTPTKNGVVTSILQSKEGLERRGHKVVVLTVDTPRLKGQDTTVYRFPSIPFNSDIDVRLALTNQRCVDQIVQGEHIDIIHTHTEFSVGWAAKRAARRFGLPLVHTAHTMYEAYRHYLFLGRWVPAWMIRKWLDLFLRNHTALICPSTKSQDYFTSYIPHIKTVVVGNGVCKARFKPGLLTRQQVIQTRKTLGIQPGDRVIVYVGRIAEEKRVLELLSALTPLLQKHSHFKALFVGRGPSYPQMIREACRNNICGQTIFTGYVDWEQMYKLYSIADVFATASLSEIHPMTLIEASMCGLPVVARRDDAYVGLIEDDYNGYLVDTDAAIVERLSEILGDEAKLTELSENSLTLSDRFNAETHVEKLESLYRQILSNGAASL